MPSTGLPASATSTTGVAGHARISGVTTRLATPAIALSGSSTRIAGTAPTGPLSCGGNGSTPHYSSTGPASGRPSNGLPRSSPSRASMPTNGARFWQMPRPQRQPDRSSAPVSRFDARRSSKRLRASAFRASRTLAMPWAPAPIAGLAFRSCASCCGSRYRPGGLHRFPSITTTLWFPRRGFDEFAQGRAAHHRDGGLLLVFSHVVLDGRLQPEHRSELPSEHQGSRAAGELRDLDGADRTHYCRVGV